MFPAVKQQLASLCCYMQKRPLVDPYQKMLMGSQALIYVCKRASGKQSFNDVVCYPPTDQIEDKMLYTLTQAV